MSKLSLAPLMEPMRIRGATLPNRFIMGPMIRKGAAAGIPSVGLGAYYRRRVEAGVGTIFTGMLYVRHEGTADGFGLGEGAIPDLWTDAALEGWRHVIAGVHDAGGLIFPQLGHIGAMREDGLAFTPSGTWGPTDRPTGYSKEAVAKYSRPGHAMSEADIAAVIAAFAAAARNAKAVGFDGIALHGGHGYLIDNFLWAGTNLRTDGWGGDPVARTRFAVEIIRAVRAAIGEDMPISFRFSQWKPQDFTGRLAETPRQLEEILEPIGEAGVDIFEASAREFQDPAFSGASENLAYWTRKITGKPTVLIGGPGIKRVPMDAPLTPPQTIDNLDEIMRRFEYGEFDLVALARAVLNDPQWGARAQAGDPFLPFDPACLRMDNLH